MAAALELMIIPVVVLVAIIVMGVWTNLSVGTVIFGALFLVLLFSILTWLLRYAWQVEEFEGVHEETGETATGARRGRKSVETATDVTTSAATDVTTSAATNEVEATLDIVEECGDESFPASDPPAWTLGPNHEPAPLPKDHH